VARNTIRGTFADKAARVAAVNVAADINQIYLQLDTASYYTCIAEGAGEAGWEKRTDTNKYVLNCQMVDISSATVSRVVVPQWGAGVISRITTVINGTIATADAVLTASIATTAITGGAVTIAYSGSAAGDADSTSPSALNIVAAGDVLKVVSGAASTNTILADIAFEITMLD
jgi:hypothetical protein